MSRSTTSSRLEQASRCALAAVALVALACNGEGEGLVTSELVGSV